MSARFTDCIVLFFGKASCAYMWVHLPAHWEVTWDAQGYRGYVGHGRGCGESSVSLDPTIHNSTPAVGAGVPGPGARAGPGVGFGERIGRRGG